MFSICEIKYKIYHTFVITLPRSFIWLFFWMYANKMNKYCFIIQFRNDESLFSILSEATLIFMFMWLFVIFYSSHISFSKDYEITTTFQKIMYWVRCFAHKSHYGIDKWEKETIRLSYINRALHIRKFCKHIFF